MRDHMATLPLRVVHSPPSRRVNNVPEAASVAGIEAGKDPRVDRRADNADKADNAPYVERVACFGVSMRG
jgi:hypothetical protein